jgi:hypothetical protein
VVLPNQVIPAQQTIKQWFNQAAFATQGAGTYGNSGRFNVHAPGTWNVDLGVTRLFSIRERFHLESRIEMFNILNHGNWGSPTVSNTSNTFGQITSFSPPRIIQLALKLTY